MVLALRLTLTNQKNPYELENSFARMQQRNAFRVSNLTLLVQPPPALQRLADGGAVGRAHAAQVARLLGHVPLAHVVHGALERAQGQVGAWKKKRKNRI